VATCTSDYPLVTVGDQADLIAQTTSTVDIALAIVSVLLLVAILIGFVLAGVVAAVWPAVRAARLNVLAAIAYE
jgi:ABC-type antimicrobial peptide transport system permease subunit